MMICDYCKKEIDIVVSFLHPSRGVQLVCVPCIDSMDEELMRAEGEPLKKEGGRKDCLSKDL